MDKAPLAQRRRHGALGGADQPGRAVGDDQQRAGQAALAQVTQEPVPRVARLPGRGVQADERRLAPGGDPPRGQHRLGRRVGVVLEEAGVQEQVVQLDAIQPPVPPRLVLGPDLLADPRHRRLADRRVRAARLRQGRLCVPDRQPADEPGDNQGLQRVGLGYPGPEQGRGELLRRAAQLRPLQRNRPRGGLDGHRAVPVAHAVAGRLAGRGPLIAVPAQERGDLGLQRRLQQSWAPSRATCSIAAARSVPPSNSASIWARSRSVGDTRGDTGVAPSSKTLAGLEGNLRPCHLHRSRDATKVVRRAVLTDTPTWSLVRRSPVRAVDR
jgi:hypothetical protein